MTLPRRNRPAPEALESRAILVVRHLVAARQLVGIDSALAAALNTRVSADRQDPALLASEHAARECDVHERFHVVHAEAMLSQPHAVDEHRGPGARVRLGESEHVVAREPGIAFERLPRQRGHERLHYVEAARMA